MFKLRIVSGPNAGVSYDLVDGETGIGRGSENQIVLASAKISKKHCVLVSDHGKLVLEDQGSSNGTFVNGSLVKSRKLRPGDKIGLGEYLLELTEKGNTQSLSISASHESVKNVIPFSSAASKTSRSGLDFSTTGVSAAMANAAVSNSSGNSGGQNTDLKGKVLNFFESKLMPFFYENNKQSEWRTIMMVVMLVFSLLAVVISIYPLMTSTEILVVKESIRRARFIARQVADKNAPFLAAKTETKTEIGASLENAEGVRVAILIDMDNRILAPSTRMNQYLLSGPEAKYAVEARDLFRTGRESGVARQLNDNTVAAIEPVKIFNPATGQNIIGGMAVVSLDISVTTPNWGEVGIVYSEAFIFVGLLGLLVFCILYRMTCRPLEVLNQDMDRVLRGEMQAVTRNYRFEELGPLMDIINSALQRAVKFSGNVMDTADLGPGVDEFVSSLRHAGDNSSAGMVICDGSRNVVYINSVFEEVTGIRSDGALGQELTAVARDQAFASFVQDGFDRVQSGSSGIIEDFDISGVTYRVSISAFGTLGGAPRSYLMTMSKGEG